jgi:lipoprotein-releasing system permease protein
LNFLFAWRYFKAKKSTNAINIIAWVSMIAIIVISAAFIIVLSVFNGFEGLVKSLYSSFYADLRISPKEGKTIVVTQEQFSKMRQLKNIKAFSKIVEEKSLLQNGEIQTIVYLKGVDENYREVTSVANNLIRGKFDLGTPDRASIVLGSGIENALGLQSDRNLYPITAYLFKRGVNINVVDPYQAFSAENVSTTGTFFIQQDLDNKYAITNVGFLKSMLSLGPDEYGSVEVAVKNESEVGRTKKELEQLFRDKYLVETRYEQNKSLFGVMNFERWAIYGILTLMMVVASFTMIGALTMLVLEKQKDIQVLKAMGADNSRIRRIFLTEGIMLAAIGAVTGVLLATLICWLQVKYKLIAIEGGTFLIDYYPVEMNPSDSVLVLFTVMVVGFGASWFPARRAALQPVELKS